MNKIYKFNINSVSINLPNDDLNNIKNATMIFDVSGDNCSYNIPIEINNTIGDLGAKLIVAEKRNNYINSVSNIVKSYLVDYDVFTNELCENAVSSSGYLNKSIEFLETKILNYFARKNDSYTLDIIARCKDNSLAIRSNALACLSSIMEDTVGFMNAESWVLDSNNIEECLLLTYLNRTHKYVKFCQFGQEIKSLLTDPINGKELPYAGLVNILLKYYNELRKDPSIKNKPYFKEDEIDYLFKRSIEDLEHLNFDWSCYWSNDIDNGSLLKLMILCDLKIDDYFELGNDSIHLLLALYGKCPDKLSNTWLLYKNPLLKYAKELYTTEVQEDIEAYKNHKAGTENDSTEKFNYSDATAKSFVELISNLNIIGCLSDAQLVKNVYNKYLIDCGSTNNNAPIEIVQTDLSEHSSYEIISSPLNINIDN